MTLGRALRAAYVRSGVREMLPTELKNAIRRRWVRMARRSGYPISSPKRPRPHLVRRRRFPRLTHVLLASDLNPRYLESWELARRGWAAVAELEPVLVLVADEADAPQELVDDPWVRLFHPLDGVHTALQAQCIRLLYPALVDAPGFVLISDMELVPLDPRYFHAPLARLDDRFFVSYRDALVERSMIAMPYNAARPETWGEVFGVTGVGDVRRLLREWAAQVEYDGLRGGAGWFTDQERLYEGVLAWAARTGRFWMLDDDYTGFSRLNRPELKAEGGVTPRRRREILGRRYTDYNSAVPHGRYRELNDLVLDLALESLGRTPSIETQQRLPLRSA